MKKVSTCTRQTRRSDTHAVFFAPVQITNNRQRSTMKSPIRSNRDSAAAAALPAVARRTFLAGIAALSASTFLPGCATDSKSAAATGGKAFRIDTHHHHIPPNYLASIPRQRGGGK